MKDDRSDLVRSTLLVAIDCAFDRQSWHGANLMSAIRAVRFADAARRVHGRRSIWEQVLHAAYWKHRVLTKLTGRRAFPRAGSDWPRLPAARTEQSWRADVALLRGVHAELRGAIAALSPAALSPNTAWLIHGAAAHDVYHAGQIKLLRRMIL